MKATHTDSVKKFTDIPNVGPKIAADFVLLGIRDPQELAHLDPYTLYKKIERITGVRHDPCVLDTFMAVVDFMNGSTARPWHDYTNKRKKLYGQGH